MKLYIQKRGRRDHLITSGQSWIGFIYPNEAYIHRDSDYYPPSIYQMQPMLWFFIEVLW